MPESTAALSLPTADGPITHCWTASGRGELALRAGLVVPARSASSASPVASTSPFRTATKEIGRLQDLMWS